MEKYIRCLMTVALITSVLSGCLIFPGGGRSREKVVVLETNKGLIVVELYPQAAPKTVDNFKTLIQQGFYDGLSFHRYVEGFVIQGGCPRGDGTGDPGWSIEGEFQEVGNIVGKKISSFILFEDKTILKNLDYIMEYH